MSPGHIFEDGRCVVCQAPGEREPSESEVERLTRQLAGAVGAAAKLVAAWDVWHKDGARFTEPPSPWMDLSDAIRELRAAAGEQ